LHLRLTLRRRGSVLGAARRKKRELHGGDDRQRQRQLPHERSTHTATVARAARP